MIIIPKNPAAGFWERELHNYVGRKGHYMQSWIDALRVLAQNGHTAEEASQYVLSKVTNGQNPMADMGLYLMIRNLKNMKGQ